MKKLLNQLQISIINENTFNKWKRLDFKAENMLNQDQIKNYHEKGYVVLDNFFCKAELHSVKEEIGLIVRSYLKKNKIFNDITLDQALFKIRVSWSRTYSCRL